MSILNSLKPLYVRLFPPLFVVLCFFTIVAVSAFDTWSTAANTQILRMEQNPICMALLRLDPEGCVFFVLGKSAGTLVTLSTLIVLLKSGYRHAMLVTGSVATFQLGLLTYLCLSDPMMHGLPNFLLLFKETPESIFQLR